MACDAYGRCASQVPGQVNNLVIGLSDAIRKAPLPNGNPQTVIAESSRGNLAVDTTNGFLYYASGSALKRANLDGTNPAVILSGLTNPRDPVVDARVGKLYWAENGRIGRANLDGSGVETLVNGSAIGALAVDPARGKLYWGDGSRFYGANLDGSGVKQLHSGITIVGAAVHADTGLVFFAETSPNPALFTMRLYATNYDGAVTQLTARNVRATGLLGVDPNAGHDLLRRN
jgi:hypothetical protein